LVKHGLGVVKVDTESLNDVNPHLGLSPIEHFGVFSENTEHNPWLGVSPAPVSLVHQLLCLLFNLLKFYFGCLGVSEFQLLNGLLETFLLDLLRSDEGLEL
jgi:hypothetical protein